MGIYSVRQINAALLEAEQLADKYGYRVALVELQGKLEAIKASSCIILGVRTLEVVRPTLMKPRTAYRDIEFAGKCYKRV